MKSDSVCLVCRKEFSAQGAPSLLCPACREIRTLWRDAGAPALEAADEDSEGIRVAPVSEDAEKAPASEGTLPKRQDRDRYEILDELGRGGMGVVLQCLDNDIRREIAMKVLHSAKSGPWTRSKRYSAGGRIRCGFGPWHSARTEDASPQAVGIPMSSSGPLHGPREMLSEGRISRLS